MFNELDVVTFGSWRPICRVSANHAQTPEILLTKVIVFKATVR